MRRAPIPPEIRCRRTNCARKAVHDGQCLAHAKGRRPLLNTKRAPGGSGPEKARRAELDVLLQVGAIMNLREQVPFSMDVNGVHITTWKADFVYEDAATGETIVEDAKAGLISDRHVLCMRLMRGCHGITVREMDMRTGAARNRKVRRIR